MQITLDLAQIAGLLGTLVGVLWAFGRLLLTQIERRLDERFTALDQHRQDDRAAHGARMDRLDETTRHLERQVADLRAELPREYQRREDAIRSESTVMAKLDNLSLKIDGLVGRGGA